MIRTKNWHIVLFFALYTLFTFIIVGITGQEAMITPLKQLDGPEDIKELNRQLRELRDSTPLDVYVGSFTCPASTGSYSVTGVGFSPRCVEFKGGVASATVANIGSGWMDYNGNQGSWSIAGKDDLQITNIDATRCLVITDETNSNIVTAKYSSMDADGFTITVGTASNLYGILYKAER